MLKGFKNFLLRGNVVDLAVAVVIGSAFNNIVNSFVKDFVTPLIAAFGGKKDFSQIYFTLNKSKFMVGDFLNSLIAFLIIASVVYFILVWPKSEITQKLQGEKTPSEKTCPQCLSNIPKDAKKCKYCTSVLK